MKFLLFVFLTTVFLLPPLAWSQKGPKVLDFEADVIEGERKSPDLFLNVDVETTNLEVLIMQRKDFNDFHDVDHKRKPQYQTSRVKK